MRTGIPYASTIGIGAWMGTIMLFNVWVLLWPNPPKVLGFVEATAEEPAYAASPSKLASRTNTLLSPP
jgi:Predicted membrane protein